MISQRVNEASREDLVNEMFDVSTLQQATEVSGRERLRKLFRSVQP